MWVNISKYLFKLYIIWSVCADIVLDSWNCSVALWRY
jgi:hypothetical protein